MAITVKVNCSGYNVNGVEANLESNDSFADVLLLVREERNGNAKRVCTKAAQVLRTMADRFDALANEEKPMNEATHKRINRAKKAKSEQPIL